MVTDGVLNYDAVKRQNKINKQVINAQPITIDDIRGRCLLINDVVMDVTEVVNCILGGSIYVTNLSVAADAINKIAR